ncbi:MAG: ATP-dependent DNA helicase [Candidatus Wallbacteria bacterium]|nr:ATP-dependent DNA helicase [Candidatus Wallbacteria bacterium]
MLSGEIFSLDGLLSQKLPGFEYREQQQTMAAAVEEAICNQKLLLVEAGPGTGKSLAYLFPALCSGRLPVIVSTHTINLQNQLLKKDIPQIEAILQRRIKALLLKGRNNYVCRKKVEEIGKNGLEVTLFNQKEVKKSLALYERIVALGAGDKEEIPFPVPAVLWQELSSDTETCLRGKCPFIKSCHFHNVRKKISESELIVTNHALFFNELLNRISGVEECYPLLIFDEAHHLIRVATDYYTVRLNQKRFQKILGHLHKQVTLGKSAPTTPKHFSLSTMIRETEKKAQEYFSLLQINRDRRTEVTLDSLRPDRLDDLFNSLVIIREKALNLIRDGALRLENPEFMDFFGNFIDSVGIFLNFDAEEHVFYLEKNENSLQLNATRSSVAELLFSELFSGERACVLTSATLGVEGDFSYLKKNLGIPDATGLGLDSPFDFESQALLYASKSLPDVESADFLPEAGLALEELLESSQGRAFLLFTSYSMLDRFWEHLADSLKIKGFSPMRQGELSRSLVLDEFKRLEKPVLFATDSFWEGVDVPGDDLSLVVVMRLPFAVPDDPLQKRRNEIVSAAGENPFKVLSLPEAILKLRQGFGRLIRTATDRGVLAIMDNRFQKKSYGRIIRDSLPKMRITDSLATVREFFNGL